MPLVAVMMVFGVIMAVPVPACPAGAVFAVVMRFCAVTAVSTVCVCFVVAMLIPVVVAVQNTADETDDMKLNSFVTVSILEKWIVAVKYFFRTGI